jgi:hypothetical protein
VQRIFLCNDWSAVHFKIFSTSHYVSNNMVIIKFLKLFLMGKFYTVYKEHVQYIRNNSGNSGYSKHIVNMRNAYGCVKLQQKSYNWRKKGNF